jgi:hypothetical protein
VLSFEELAMKTLRLAAGLAAVPFVLATTHAAAHAQGGHMMGSGHAGRAHFAAPAAHGFHHDGFRHDGRFGEFHHHHLRHFGSALVIGGVWYPWYAYSAPVYAAPVYPTNTWYYYCPSTASYYPQVTVCPEPWVLVAP